MPGGGLFGPVTWTFGVMEIPKSVARGKKNSSPHYTGGTKAGMKQK